MRKLLFFLTALAAACGGGAPATHPTTTAASASASAAKPAPTTSASAQAATPIKPPSTGHEFVPPKVRMPTKTEALGMFRAGLAEASKPAPDCARATSNFVRVGFDIAEPDVAFVRANEGAMVGLAHCAESQHSYMFLVKLGAALANANAGVHAELIARGLLGVGMFREAMRLLKIELKSRPKDPHLNLTAAKTLCHLDDWADCGKAADATLKLVTPPKTPEDKEVGWRAQKYRARSLLHAGRFDEAVVAADAAVKLGAPASFADGIKKEVVPTKATMTVVEKQLGDHIPLGGYHLFGKVPSIGSVLEVHLYDVDAKDHQYKVEAEIAGVTEHAVQTVTVLKGKSELVKMNPPLKTTFDVNSIRADTPAQMALKITRLDSGKELVVDEETLPTTLQPRDTLPLWRYLDRDHAVQVNTFDFVGAWITPNAKAVEDLITAAKKRLPPHTSFSGEQAPTLPQVKAIYEELQSRGMSYVEDPALFTGGEDFTQRTRLPSEVLQSTNAQCLEGTLLYASALESIGLRPVLAFIPGHAFVGWAPGGHDTPPPSKNFFLETTATHDAPWDKVVPFAEFEYTKEKLLGHFAPVHGAPTAHLVWVDRLRAEGASPQPWN